VQAASLSSYLPLQGMATPMRFQLASRPLPPSERPRASFWCLSEGWARTLGAAVRRGRFFSELDHEAALPVAVVNEAFVKRFLPGEDPLGKRVLLDERWVGRPRDAAPPPREIVGVIADVKIGGLHDDRESPQIYAPRMQWPQPGGMLALRASGDRAALAAAVRAAVREIDPDVPLTDVRTMRQVASASVAPSRTRAWLFGSFAVAALMLAALGIYGVVSCMVERRTREIGIRMALGARPADVLRMVLGGALSLAAAGLALGLAGSLVLTRAVESMLYHVRRNDPLTYAAASLLLLATAALAAWVPARRASRVDPLTAVRWE
jgi:putative ABC transport system permease protein